MKFSIIIPTAKKDTRFLRRALLSLQDQDHKDWEAIVVCDGHIVSPPVESNHIIYYPTNGVKGASYARNLGAKQANHELLFFFDADCVLLPGMLRLVNDIFVKHNPDFVYSGYRFNTHNLNTYPSRPFDPYLLESMNYINTMSPMKREVFDKVGGFREDLPYFQDWDFFLRAVKDHKFKGYFLRDMMFQTEVPNRMSISGDPQYSWYDKITKIESLNNIEKRPICMTTLTAPYQAIERAKILNARYMGLHNTSGLLQLPSQFNFRSETVILQGFFPLAAEQHMMVFPKDAIKVINWIGTDVWQLHNKFNWNNIRHIKENYLSKIDLQFCNSPGLHRELAELGIDTKIVYQPLTESVEVTPFPKRPTISAYCSDGHPLHSEFYIRDLARSMPDIDFVLYGTKLNDSQYDNIRFMGFMPIQDIIDLTTMHIRITQHDGFPHSPIYYAMAGRHVLTNFKMEYCDFIDNVPNDQTWEEMKKDIIEYVRSNINIPIRYDVDKCVDYYRNLCDPNKYKRIMLDEIQKVKEATQLRVAVVQQLQLPSSNTGHASTPTP